MQDQIIIYFASLNRPRPPLSFEPYRPAGFPIHRESTLNKKKSKVEIDLKFFARPSFESYSMALNIDGQISLLITETSET